MDTDERSEDKAAKSTDTQEPKGEEPSGSATAGSPATTMIAVSAIRTHPTFENLLRIDEEEQQRFSRKMGEDGYYESEAVVLAIWQGLEEGPVMIDGHRRWKAALANGIKEIPCVIVEFPDMMATLKRAISLQMERRPSKDGTLYRLCERFDTLRERGGDRRSKEAKSKMPDGIFDRGAPPSARQTAALIGCNYRKVDKIRKIRRDATPEIQDALRNDKMSINKAFGMIREVELGTEEKRGSSAAFMKGAKVVFTEENLGRLKELSGDLQAHANAAIERYIEWLYEH